MIWVLSFLVTHAEKIIEENYKSRSVNKESACWVLSSAFLMLSPGKFLLGKQAQQ